MKLPRIMGSVMTFINPGCGVARGQNALTLGTPDLNVTYRSIGVTLPYTGDVNQNAAHTVSYRTTGSSTWQEGHDLSRVADGAFVGSIVLLNPAFRTISRSRSAILMASPVHRWSHRSSRALTGSVRPREHIGTWIQREMTAPADRLQSPLLPCKSGEAQPWV